MLHRGVLERVTTFLACEHDYAARHTAGYLQVSRLDSIVPNTPVPQRANASIKRKSAFETPAVPKFNRADGMSSPSDARSNGTQ